LGWDDILPIFKRLDCHFLGETEHHGAGGEWRVERPRVRWNVLDAVAAAAVEMGIKAVPDFNAGDVGGVGYFHVNQKRGLRWSAARAFLKPALRRPNLRLETHALTEQILFEERRAVGVRFRRADGEVATARRREKSCCVPARSERRSYCNNPAWVPLNGSPSTASKRSCIARVLAGICKITCSNARSTKSKARALSTPRTIRFHGAQ
jgi:hypothetical protein